jgi:hypothetical protein
MSPHTWKCHQIIDTTCSHHQQICTFERGCTKCTSPHFCKNVCVIIKSHTSVVPLHGYFWNVLAPHFEAPRETKNTPNTRRTQFLLLLYPTVCGYRGFVSSLQQQTMLLLHVFSVVTPCSNLSLYDVKRSLHQHLT